MLLQKVDNASAVNASGMVIRDISNSVGTAAAATRDGDSERPADVARLPPETAWFDKTKLHEKERMALPERLP